MAKIGWKKGRRHVWVSGNQPIPLPDTLQPNRIGEWFFLEGTGQKVFNAAGPNTANNNLLGFSERHWTGVSFYNTSFYVINGGSNPDTLTENFANNEDGIAQAARLQTGSGSTINGDTGVFNGIRINGLAFAAGPYTLSVAVKSNTGSSQTMRMAFGSGTISSDLTVTTSWTRVSFTFTHSGSITNLFFIINGSGGTALDILFDKVKLETGSSATPYVTPKFDLQFGNYDGSETVDPAWVTGGISLADSVAFGITDVPATTTNFSVHMCCKLDSSNPDQGYVISTAFGDNGFELIVGQGGTAKHNIQPAVNFHGNLIRTPICKIADDRVHLVSATYDGTTLKLFIDKILLQSALASISPTTISRLQIGYTPSVGGRQFTGEVYYASIYDTAHNNTDIATQYSAVSGRMAARGVSMAADNNFIMCEGDSITIDIDSYAKHGICAITTPNLAHNKAVVGNQIAQLVSNATVVDSYITSRPKNILSVFIGANDLSGATTAAQFVADLKSYCLARRAAGWLIVACTVLPRKASGVPNYTKRNAANALIVADTSFYDAICRFDLVSGMGADGDEANATNYDAQETHPTNAGSALLMPTWKAAVESLF